MRVFLIKEEEAMAIGNYLVNKPYIEVRDLVPMLEALPEYEGNSYTDKKVELDDDIKPLNDTSAKIDLELDGKVAPINS